MLEKLKVATVHVVQAATTWVDPNWWICSSLILFALCLVHPVPLRLPDVHIYSLKAHVAVWIRRVGLALLFAVVFLFPMALFIAFGMIARGDRREAAQAFYDWALDQLAAYWTAPLAAVMGGLVISVVWHRYAEPYLSDKLRKYRVRQGIGEQSDVKREGVALASQTYDPRAHYKAGHYFLGLDDHRAPVYVSDREFHSTMSLFVGPTGTGKGSIFQVIGDQAVNKGVCVFYVDPKGDDNIPLVLSQAASRAGKPFIYLDLNPGGQGHWHPFKGGELRDRRSRMIGAFKLFDAGSDADVYKAAERASLDTALSKTDGGLKGILDFIEKNGGADKELSKLRDSLKEWTRISTFTPPKKNRGHSIEQSLRNGAIVYLRGSTSDEVVRLATRCYIEELCQEIKRLKREREGVQTTIFVDETRFVVSNELVDALATIRDTGTNIICGTQAFSDLRNVRDRDLDKDSLQQSFTINCKIKLLYQAADDATAEWGEVMSGTTFIRVPVMERTDVNRWGGEKWDDTRTMRREEVPLISKNKLLMLPERVGILYRPGIPASVLFSSYIPLKDRSKTWEKAKAAEKADAEDAQHEAHDAGEVSDQAELERGMDVDRL